MKRVHNLHLFEFDSGQHKKRQNMSTINNSYLSQTSLRSQTTNSTSSSQEVEKTEAQSNKKKTGKLEGSEIVVSSRAQKLQALSREFFAGGVNATNISALKERAFEYGLISEGQYNRLASVKPSEGTKEAEKTSQSLADQLNEVDKKIKKRNDALPEDKRQDVSQLSKVLSDAAKILDDPETAITKPDFQADIKASINSLNDIIDSDTFTNLPVSERSIFTNSASALSVIESLAPRNLTNSKLNQYLAHSFR